MIARKARVSRVWAKSRKARNKACHIRYGNTSVATSVALKAVVVATLLPLVWKTEQEAEMLVGTASRFAARVVEETEEVTTNLVQTTGLVAKAGVLSLGAACLWFMGSKLQNFWQRYSHGNTSSARLVELRGETSIWEVPGTRGPHRVRITGQQVGCACGAFLRDGRCSHTDSAKAALGALNVPEPIARATHRARAATGRNGGQTHEPSFSGCFQGLVTKAKELKESSILALQDRQRTVAEEDARKAKHRAALDSRRRISESLSLDSSSDELVRPASDPAVGAVSSRPDAGLPAIKDVECLDVKFLANRDSHTRILLELAELKAKPAQEVLVTVYTCDQPDLLEGLTECRTPVRVIADRDQSLGSRTKLQWQSLQQLVRAGVRVRLTNGVSLHDTYREDNREVNVGRSLKGIQHAKTAMIHRSQGGQDVLVVGSANFTTSSRGNVEMGLAVSGPAGSEVFEDYRRFFERMWDSSTVFDGSAPRSDPPRRLRGKQSMKRTQVIESLVLHLR